MAFASLYGLDGPIAALRRALANDQLAGSYLFTGPPSVGKTALALEFAGAAACLNARREPFDACGECISCRLAEGGKHPEITLISPAGDLTQIWQFWDRDGKPAGALSRSLTFAPTVGRKRVYIVERADTLNEAAANSLLKALEEPPPYVLFVLLTPQTSRMLPTILSRCQLIRLPAASLDGLAHFVSRRASVPADRALTCAAYSEGRTGLALRLAQDPATDEEIGRAVDLALGLARAKPVAALRLGEAIRKFGSGLKAIPQDDAGKMTGDAADDGSAPRERVGRKQVGATLDLLAAVFRDLLSLSLGGSDAKIAHTGRRAELWSAADDAPPDRWMSALDRLLTARRRLDQNCSIPLLTDWLAAMLVYGR
jgi:DNA polymerase-3 subunit delta'